MARSVIVFIENLGLYEYYADCTVVESGNVEALGASEVLRRSLRLTWRVDRTSCSFAASFTERDAVKASSPAASAQDTASNEASELGPATGRRLVVAVAMPALKEGFEGWVSKLAPVTAKPPRFLVKCEALRGDYLSRAVAEAPALADASDGNLEWIVVRNDADALELRVRILPPEAADVSALAVIESDVRSVPSVEEEPSADAKELERLKALQAMEKILNQQAASLAQEMGSEPVDLERVKTLPERIRIDLLLSLLSAYRRHNEMMMAFWGGECKGNRGLMESVSAVVDEKIDKDASLQLQTSFIAHSKRAYLELVKYFGFDTAESSKRMSEVASAFWNADFAKDGGMPPAKLYAAVRQSLNETANAEAASKSTWTANDSACLGSESDAMQSIDDAWLMDSEVSASSCEAAEMLSAGAFPCAQDLCICRCDKDDSYYLLSRGGPSLAISANRSVASHEEKQIAKANSPLRIPRAWILARDVVAIFLGASGGVFDARGRVSMLALTSGLGVPLRVVAKCEEEIGGVLFELLEASSAVERQKKNTESWNKGKVALAAAGGGVLLAVTGGLAAPAVAGGMTALGATAASAGAYIGFTTTGYIIGSTIAGLGVALTSLGTTGAVVLFGATGAGLTGFKMANRWGCLEDFSFVPLNVRTVHTSLVLSDTAVIKKLDAAMGKGDGELLEDLIVKDEEGKPAPLLQGSKLCGRTTVAGNAASSRSDSVRFDLERRVDSSRRAVHLVLFASGWLKHGEDDFTKPWAEIAQMFFPCSGHLALRWEATKLRRLNDLVSGQVKREVLAQSASWWVKASTASAFTAGSIAATAAAWPVSIVCALSNLDNAWIVCTEKARLAGQCLASILVDKSIAGRRPVTLIGHSMGARMLFYCCLELYRMNEFDIVQDVVFLGMPVATRETRWRQVRAVTSGRVVNCFLPSDWMLAFLYRYLEWGLTVAGLSKVATPGIENVDLTGLGIENHAEYLSHLPDIMAKARLGDRLPPKYESEVFL